MLYDYETKHFVGHVTPITLNYEEEDEGTGEECKREEGTNQGEREVFESPSLSIPGVMDRLTGSHQKPISGEKFKIQV